MPRDGSSPIRVLHVFGGLHRGGAELRTLEVLRQLDRSRFRFNVVALGGQYGELAETAAADGVHVDVCPLGRGFGRRFRTMLRRLEVDVLHSHVHYASGYLLWMARRAGVSSRIAHFRSTGDGQGNSPRRRVQRAAMKRLIDRYATRILAVSEAAMTEAWDAQWRRDPRCSVLLNGLDTSRFTAAADPAVRAEFGWPPDAPLFINVASFQPEKNQARVVEVFKAITVLTPGARLLFVGREVSGYQSRVRDVVRAQSLEGCVAFAGERADVPRLLKSADVLLFPSLREGLPGAVLESCAAGLPVVATDLPGVLEIGRYFPIVHPVGLTQSNHIWATRAVEAAQGRGRCDWRDFETTPFSLRAAARSLSQIYEVGVCVP
jgi:glycosyltransferase involved in cell wall biosynthesis